MTFRSFAKAAALAAVSVLLVTGIVKAVDCTVDLCGFSAGQATGLRDTFVDQLNTETIAGAKTFSSTLTYATLNDGTTDLGATALELNAVADVSARLVTLTADTSITEALHSGRIILLGEVGGNAQLEATLPEATGSGLVFKFIISVTNTSDYEIQVATNDTFFGYIVHIDGNLTDTANSVFEWAAVGDDTLDMDGDTLCGAVGDWVEVTDILTDVWAIYGVCRSDGDAFATMWAAERT